MLHDVKSQVLNQVTSSHQVEVAFCLTGGINPAPEGGDAEAGPGDARGAFVNPSALLLGPNLETAEVSTLDCGIDPVGGPGAITATAGRFFFFGLGCWGLSPRVLQTHGCKMN